MSAKELLLWNESLPEDIRVTEVTPEGHATKLYAVVLDYGWAERIIAGDCYDHDADLIATALREALEKP